MYLELLIVPLDILKCQHLTLIKLILPLDISRWNTFFTCFFENLNKSRATSSRNIFFSESEKNLVQN